MKKAFSVFLIIFFSFSLANAQHSNCGVSPYPNTFTQPNGSVITLLAYGNEAVNYVETSDGYTVLRNSEGNYEYAIVAPDGNLTLSGIKASNTSPLGKTEIQKHLRYSSEQISVLMQYHEKKYPKASLGKTGANVFPPEGDRKVLVLLMEYPDLRATIDKADFELLFNQTNYNNTGSFKDYYQKASYGKLNLTCDVYGWYMAENNYKYYSRNSGNWSATNELLENAILAADSAGVDFSQYDSDSDGYVDAVLVLHAGIGAEEASAPNSGDYIWSFRSTMWGSPVVDNKQISAYGMFPERRYYTNAMVGIGVMSHEFGHILDLPDLYATNFNGVGGGPEGIGNFAIMAGGPWLNSEKTPCMHDAWSKIQLGWLTPVTIDAIGDYTIPKSAVDSNFAFKINTSRPNEYFLLENKQLKGQDAYIPGKGLAIWHINSNKAGKLSVLSNDANNDTANLGVGLLQADGKRNLELGNNRGDAGDLFPGSTNNANATPFTKPNTSLYNKVSGVRQSSGIYIQNITLNPDSSITFKFGALPSASYIASATTGCSPLTVSFTNKSTFANNYKWDFGTGTIATSADTSYTFTTAGNYSVWLNVLDSVGKVVDSTQKVIQVFVSPKALFTVSRNNNTITLTNNSTDAYAYSWKFGSFSSSTKNPESFNLRDLQDSGFVPIRLIAFSSGGCSDTAKTSLEIYSGIFENEQNAFNVSLYPNPIAQNAKLSFYTNQTTQIGIEIYNILGEKISVIENKELQSGKHEYEITKAMLPSTGVYIIRIRSDKQTGYIRLINE